MGRGQRWRIIDAVTDHRWTASGIDQGLEVLDLILGLQIGLDLLNPQCGAHGMHGSLAIATEQMGVQAMGV